MTLIPKDTRQIIRVKKIAHATYETPDLDQQIEYYTNVLGLNLVAREKDAAYLASTIDHHSVVLRKGGAAQCVRIGFQLGTDDDLDAFVQELRRVISDPAVEVVITTGGTGVTGRDVTPEALEALFEKKIEGFGETFRWISFQKIGTSTMQSRATAGVANGTYIFALPGSTGACKDGWDDILVHQLDNRFRPCNLVELMPRLQEHLRPVAA